MDQVDIAVVGAGVIGLAIAHRLAATGREVMILDADAAGAGASYGNAGTVADYAVQPVGTPEVLKALPSLLFDRNSPLAIRRAALPSLAPWLLRFAFQSFPSAARANATVLAGLLADAAPRWRDLAAEVGGDSLLQDRGCLYWYRTDAQLTRAKADLAFRQGLGVSVDLLNEHELQALEPNLPVEGGGAAYFPKALFMSDPGAMVGLLAADATRKGAMFRQMRVQGLARQSGGLVLSGEGQVVRARTVILATGAHGKILARQAGDKVPLDTERGYHLEWDMPTARLNRPTCPTALGFYLCPMSGRLRVAGTVELGGLHAPPSPHRLALLHKGAQTIFPDLGPADRSWMGFRPSMPDSLPVIGPSAGGPDVLHAYGHGHIGLTLAPITATLIETCLERRDDPRLPALSPQRF